MRRLSLLTLVFGFLLFAASSLSAQASRTWVSGVGDDVNPCSRTAPCKTFAGAISKTAAGGEISVLDPGGFGAVTITKSITINGEGTLAGILAAGTNGVIVNPGVNDVVVLRNISINGVGTGLNGIRHLNGRLRVEKCTIEGFSSRGIDVVHTSTSTPGELVVVDSRFVRIGTVAIRVDNGATAVAPRVALDNVNISRSGFGVDVLKSGFATINRSMITDITNQAIVAENTATINATDCVLSRNGTGIQALNTSTVRIANCRIFGNTTGVNIAVGATGDTFGNNAIFGNTTNFVGTTNLVPLE
jgi:hypothetical protein